jgi:NitT/TauT family transport system permease protein
MLLAQAGPTTLATIEGFLLSAAFGIPVAMLIAGSRTVESYVYPLLVFSQSIPKIAIAPLFLVSFDSEVRSWACRANCGELRNRDTSRSST